MVSTSIIANRRDSVNSREGNRCGTWERPCVRMIILARQRERSS